MRVRGAHPVNFEEMELRRQVLERANSDPRIIRFVVNRYGSPNGEPFFQELLQRAKSDQAAIDARLAELDKQGRFKPSKGQVPVEWEEPAPRRREPPLQVDEVPELTFLPYLRAAASGRRGSR